MTKSGTFKPMSDDLQRESRCGSCGHFRPIGKIRKEQNPYICGFLYGECEVLAKRGPLGWPPFYSSIFGRDGVSETYLCQTGYYVPSGTSCKQLSIFDLMADAI
jgi:hypothetical protein